MFSNLHERLRDNERFEINQRDADRRKRVDVEEAVLDHFIVKQELASVELQHLSDYRTIGEFRVHWMEIIINHEATFTRSEVFNLHNHHGWQLDNPHIVREHASKQRYSVNVWAGIFHNSIIGPYIMPSPLNRNNYRVFSEKVLPEPLENVPLAVRRSMLFQQDGLQHTFIPQCSISQYMDWSKWPCRLASKISRHDSTRFIFFENTWKPLFIQHLCNQRKISLQELQ